MSRSRIGLAGVLALLFGLGAGCANLKSQGAEVSSRMPLAHPPAVRHLPHPDFLRVGIPRGAWDVADVVERVVPSVVSISATHTEPINPRQMPFGGLPFHPFFGPGLEQPMQRRAQGMGSGVAIAKDVILTNNHVVEGADEIRVTTHDNHELAAELVGTDPKTDLAVLRLKRGEEALRPIRMGDSARLRLGDPVIAIGNPFGVGQTVTMGIVSAKGRADLGIVDYEDFIQTDAAINPGSSGGALINTAGELVGINTAILSRSGGNQGIGFAIPTKMAKPIAAGILEHGKVTRGWLGVAIQDLNADLAKTLGIHETAGVLVAEVENGTPAAAAGVKRGDVVLRADGERVEGSAKLRSLVAMAGPGKQVALDLIRDGHRRTLTVALGELPGDSTPARVQPPGSGSSVGSNVDGLTLEVLNDSLRQRYGIEAEVRQGLVVTGVTGGSGGGFAALRPGDIVLEIDRVPVSSPEHFQAVWQKVQGRALVLIHRRGHTLFVVAEKSAR